LWTPSYLPAGRGRAIDTDVGLQSVNIGIQSACRKASDRTLWPRIVDTATLRHGATEDRMIIITVRRRGFHNSLTFNTKSNANPKILQPGYRPSV